MRIRVTNNEPVPDGEHDAICVDVTEVEGRYGPQIRFRFELVDGRRVSMWTGISSNANSRLVQTVEAITAKRFADGDEFDLEEVVGKKCRIVVEGGRVARVVAVPPTKAEKPANQAETPMAPELERVLLASAKNRLKQLKLYDDFQRWWNEEGKSLYTPAEVAKLVLEQSPEELRELFEGGDPFGEPDE